MLSKSSTKLYFTFTIKDHVEPHPTGDERVIVRKLRHKVVLLFGFYGQQLSICQQRENKTNGWLWLLQMNTDHNLSCTQTTHPCADRCSWPAPCCTRCSCRSPCWRRSSDPGAAPTCSYRCSEGSGRPPGQPAIWLLIYHNTERRLRADSASSMQMKSCVHASFYSNNFAIM